MLSDIEQTLNSLKQINDFPFYSAFYFGDYKINEFRQGAIDSPSAIVPFFEDLFEKRGAPINLNFPASPSDFSIGCSSFFCRTKNGDPLFAKNLDWKQDPVLLLTTEPEEGYKSFSLVNLNFCDIFSLNHIKYKLLFAPYVPMDGINEKGVAITMLSVHKGVKYPFSSKKTMMGDFNIIRLILDFCENITEAKEMFKKYNLNQTGMFPLHYLMADKNNSCIVEFFDKKINYYEDENVNFLTNFIKLHNPDYSIEKENCPRYKLIEKTLLLQKARLNPSEAASLLKRVSVYQPGYGLPSTIWSVIYEMKKLKMKIKIGQMREFYTVALKETI